MAKTSKHAKKEPFPLDVSNLIRHHQGEIKARESQRVGAFEDRDAALAELEELKASDSPEAREAKIRHSDAERRIERLVARIKWHRKQLAEAIDGADEGKLKFMYDIDDDEDAQLTLHKPKKADKPEEPEKPKRPVGRPRKESEPTTPGLDEHLAADVNELDCNDQCKSKLKEAGFETIGDIAKVFYGVNGEVTLADRVAINQNGMAAIKRAFKAYMKLHRSAQKEVESGG